MPRSDAAKAEHYLEKTIAVIRAGAASARPNVEIPPRFRERVDFARLGWIGKSVGGARALEVSKAFAENPFDHRPPFLMGPSGCGKTTLLLAMAREVGRKIGERVDGIASEAEDDARRRRFELDAFTDCRVAWPIVRIEVATGATIAAELRDSVKSSMSEEVVSRLQQRKIAGVEGALGLLVVDDVEVLKMSDWLGEALYRIFDFRYSGMLPTAIASNLSPEELRGQLGDRIVRRILDMAVPVVMT